MTIEFVYPDWDAPGRVRALTSCRGGGLSGPPWDSLNLATHVADDALHVQANRARLVAALRLRSAPLWLAQVHGRHVADSREQQVDTCADARFSDRAGEVCAVLTADCLPVAFCNRSGTQVAVAHAGWRGLADGVLQETVERFTDPPRQLLAWLGPAIGAAAYEVGDEVRAAFVAQAGEDAAAFRAVRPGHWLADLYVLAGNALRRAGLRSVAGGGFCTFSDAKRFFSYRRDGVTGRMATLIWIEP